jgi:hypothetical protein
MRAFATIGIGSRSISFQQAISASDADRPHGIPEDAWIRLDQKLGVVIVIRNAAPSGYFMVKHCGVWQRLNIEMPPAQASLSGEKAAPQT